MQFILMRWHADLKANCKGINFNLAYVFKYAYSHPVRAAIPFAMMGTYGLEI